MKTTRRVASRWTKAHRQPKIASYTVHRSLANTEDDEERFAAILVLQEGEVPVDDGQREPLACAG